MNFLRIVVYPSVVLASIFSISSGFADIVELPTLKILAEPELRAETGIIPYQQDPQQAKALQHRIMNIQRDTQDFVVNPDILTSVDFVPEGPLPDLNSLPLGLQQYVLSIARGLQSVDPKEGLYIMLQPFGIDRNATNVQIAREQISLGILNGTLGSPVLKNPSPSIGTLPVADNR